MSVVMEKKVCDENGRRLLNDPEEIRELERILRRLDEKPENATFVISECSLHKAPAWFFGINIFENIERISVHPVKLANSKMRRIRIDNFEVCLTQEEGGFSAVVLSLPGCISQGESEEEAISNIKDAMKCYLETAKKYGIVVRR